MSALSNISFPCAASLSFSVPATVRSPKGLQSIYTFRPARTLLACSDHVHPHSLPAACSSTLCLSPAPFSFVVNSILLSHHVVFMCAPFSGLLSPLLPTPPQYRSKVTGGPGSNICVGPLLPYH